MCFVRCSSRTAVSSLYLYDILNAVALFTGSMLHTCEQLQFSSVQAAAASEEVIKKNVMVELYLQRIFHGLPIRKPLDHYLRV